MRRTMCLLLALLMCLSLLPLTVWAGEEAEPVPAEETVPAPEEIPAEEELPPAEEIPAEPEPPAEEVPAETAEPVSPVEPAEPEEPADTAEPDEPEEVPDEPEAMEPTGWMIPSPAEDVVTDGAGDYDPAEYTPEKVSARMTALMSRYPEGMPWTNDNSYTLSVPIYDVDGRNVPVTWTGYGCVAFAFILSDAAFGSLSARQTSNFAYDDVRVGDILRINSDTHSVIVLEKYSDHVVIAEGNYSFSIHWGRSLDRSAVEAAEYIITRYPDSAAAVEPTATPAPTASPAPAVGELTPIHQTSVDVRGRYYQTEARSILKMINDFRTESEVWYWNDDNSTKTVFNTAGEPSLGKLSYDYALERIAMQRAAELTVIFDHTRPNDTGCFSATYNGIRSRGENIAMGYLSAEDVFDGWREEYDMFDGQGHRRNMLNEDYTAVGVACFRWGGFLYWVQEFGFDRSDTADTSPDEKVVSVSVPVVDVSSAEEPLEGFFRDDAGNMYFYHNGEMFRDDVYDIWGQTYVFGEDGVILRNAWYDSGGYSFYFGDDGALLHDTWLELEDGTYYIDEYGTRLENETAVIDGVEYIFDEYGHPSDGSASPVPTAKPAETPEPTPEPAPSLSLAGLPAGVEYLDVVTLGSYEQDNDVSDGAEPIRWLALAGGDGNVLLLSQKILDVRPYNDAFEQTTWETCSLRSWLNGSFLNAAFTAEERSVILETRVSARGENFGFEDHSMLMNPGFHGNDTVDRVFLLSEDEVNDFMADETYHRIAAGTEYAIARGLYTTKWMTAVEKVDMGDYWMWRVENMPVGEWWLITKGAVFYEQLVNTMGEHQSVLCTEAVNSGTVGVRPAIVVDYDAYLALKDNGQKGDCDGDGTVDLADRAYLARALADAADYTVPGSEIADMDGDGVVDRPDRIALARTLAG